MRQDRGGVVSLGREQSPGAEPVIRSSARYVTPSHLGAEVVDTEVIRAVRPPVQSGLRRRLQWSRSVAAVLAAEVTAAVAVATWAVTAAQPTLGLVSGGWALAQVGAAGAGPDGRAVVSPAGTLRRAKLGAVLVLALVTIELLAPLAGGVLLGLASLSLAGRGVLAVRSRRRSTPGRVIVVGRSHEIADAVDRVARSGADVTTYCTSDADELTRGTHLQRAILTAAPDRVVVLAGTLDTRELQELSWALEDYEIDVVIWLGSGHLSPRRFQPVDEAGVQGLRIAPRGGLLGDRLWGGVNRVAAVGLLALFALPMLVVATLVRLDSSGPALFVQQRVGRHGRSFPMVKFRTMHVNAEEMLAALLEENESEGGVLFKMKGDPRVTRIGRILRATSIDELPQLLNVVRGEMALIGPRPALAREVAEYDLRARRRLAVRPGLTGLWQVSGRSNLSFDDAVRLDVDYIDNWSLRREAEIALRTVGAVVRREGAY